MARKCTLKTCRSELPSKADSDKWQAVGFCDDGCMAMHGLSKAKKQAERKRKADELGIKKRNQEFKKKVVNEDRGYWTKKAQAAFNAFIRAEDAKEPCISCQRFHDGQYHAGHYRTVGGHGELRFEEDNCHKQCSVCNNHLSGNIADYRINLVKKIGLSRVEWLEGPHNPKKYSIEDLKDIEATYKAKLKQLKLNE